MKKLYSALLTLAAAGTLSAQQLPNPGFENDWTDMACWAANKTTNNGKTAAPWKISHVASPSVAAQTVGSQDTGNGGGSAVKLENPVKVGKTIPGYLTLGQPWSTASGITGKNPDGGTFGGIDFAYRPDAVKFDYKSTGTGQPTIVAYSWKGTYTQANVPSNIVVSGSVTKVIMTDRDRNILDMTPEQGGDITQRGTRIMKLNKRLKAEQSDWTTTTFEFEYETQDTPEKFNIIFAAEDYFSASPASSNTLTIDNVELLYYSRLSSLTVNGQAVEGFNANKYNYDMSSVVMPTDASVIDYTLLSPSNSAKAQVTLDPVTLTAKIVVTNSNAGGTDIDGNSSHTYTIQFGEEQQKIEYGGTVYEGTVTLLPNEALGLDENLDIPGTVHIIADDNDASKCTFVLPDFSLAEANLGDIIVENVTATKSGSKTTYEGEVKGLKLHMGDMEINANVVVKGTTTDAGEAKMIIDVIWLSEYEDENGDIVVTEVPINVEFATEGWTDEGGETPDVPVIENADAYRGIVTLLANEDLGLDEDLPSEGIVYIINQDGLIQTMAAGDGSSYVTFLLPDFEILGSTVGDIRVENVTKTEIAGGHSYNGTKDNLQLDFLGMTISASVNLSGRTTDDGHAYMDIAVIWHSETGEQNEDGTPVILDVPINVSFNGDRVLAGIDGIEADNSEKPVEYFNIQGMRVNGEHLTPGLYIRRQGTDVKKIYVK